MARFLTFVGILICSFTPSFAAEPGDIGAIPVQTPASTENLRLELQDETAQFEEAVRLETLNQIAALRQQWLSRMEWAPKVRPFASLELQASIDGALGIWAKTDQSYVLSSPTEMRTALMALQTLEEKTPPQRMAYALQISEQVVEGVTRELIKLQHGDPLGPMQLKKLQRFVALSVAKAEYAAIERNPGTFDRRIQSLQKRFKNIGVSEVSIDELAEGIAVLSTLLEEGAQPGFAEELSAKKQVRAAKWLGSVGAALGIWVSRDWGVHLDPDARLFMIAMNGAFGFMGAAGLRAVVSELKPQDERKKLGLWQEKEKARLMSRCSELLVGELKVSK